MRIAILTLAGAVVLLPAAVLVATIAAAISLARDEDEEHDCGGTCPAHDVGPDDLEAVARVTGLVVFNAPTLAEGITAGLVDHAVEGEMCPDYPHEIKWGTR